MYSAKILTSGCNFLATKRDNKTAPNKIFGFNTITARVWVFLILVLVLIPAMPLTSARPRFTTDIRSANLTRFRPCNDRLIKRNSQSHGICTDAKVEAMFTKKLAWHNPCNIDASSENKSGHSNLDPIKSLLAMTLQVKKYGNCRKPTDWCNRAPDYSFLEHHRTKKICLRLEHKRLQVYVAALYFLNFNASEQTTVKTLLCEVETAINQTDAAIPRTISGREMCKRLKYESRNDKGSNLLDMKFTEINFGKYLRGLNRTIAETRNVTSGCCCNNCKANGSNRSTNNANRSKGSRNLNGSKQTNTSNQSNQSKRRRQHRRQHRKPKLH